MNVVDLSFVAQSKTMHSAERGNYYATIYARCSFAIDSKKILIPKVKDVLDSEGRNNERVEVDSISDFGIQSATNALDSAKGPHPEEIDFFPRLSNIFGPCASP